MTVASIQAVPLLRSQNALTDLSGLEPLAQRMAREMQALFDRYASGSLTITAGTATPARYPEWRIAQNPFGLLLRFRLANRAEEMLLHLPGTLLSQIVDLHYGGSGGVQARTEFTSAEFRFADRLGGQIAALLKAVFEPNESAPVEFAGAQADILYASWPKSREAIALQTLVVEGGAVKSAIVSLIMAADCARLLCERSGQAEVDSQYADPVWTIRMRSAAMCVHLPARTVLARSEVPLQKILTLASGDILPLLLPTQIPLTVAGHVFAHGSLGEANGRAALLIEKLEKGPNP